MTHRHSQSNNLGIVLLAGVAGAAAALLLAPRSGEETRRQLRERAESMKERAREKTQATKETAADLAEQAKQAPAKASSAIRQTKRDHDTDNPDQTLTNL